MRDTPAVSGESTTPDPVELTERLVEAFDRGDVDAIEGLGADDAVLRAMGLGLRFEGVKAIRSFVEEWFGSFADLAFELLEVQHLANGVVLVLIHQSGSPAGALGSIGQDEAWVIVWVEDEVTQLASYIDIDEARAAAESLAQGSQGVREGRRRDSNP